MECCLLCGMNTTDELLGPILRKNGTMVHHHCMFLNDGLFQNGRSTSSGILGFLLKDIRKAAEKCSKYKCYYCGCKKANIKCWDKRCSKRFHFLCGLTNNCNTQFTEFFESFCHLHAKWKGMKKPGPDDYCNICTDTFEKNMPADSLIAECCKSGWFHKRCISKYASVTGYFFKCPLCKNSEEFRLGMILRGVFVPDRDESWETERNAISEMLNNQRHCCAENCICPHGRRYNRGRYRLTNCEDCGASSVHVYCFGSEEFTCEDCRQATMNLEIRRQSQLLISTHDELSNITAEIDLTHDEEEYEIPCKKHKQTEEYEKIEEQTAFTSIQPSSSTSAPTKERAPARIKNRESTRHCRNK